MVRRHLLHRPPPRHGATPPLLRTGELVLVLLAVVLLGGLAMAAHHATGFG